MQLDAQQQQAILTGQAIPLLIQGTECVLVRKDVYDKFHSVLGEDAFNPETIYGLMETSLAEDDANDPGLHLYQKYKP
jgi:hypothetical protein